MLGKRKEVRMSTTQNRTVVEQDRWAESRRAEEQGDFEKALEIHQMILADEKASYASSLRAGWLYYKLGAFEKSFQFYERACALSDDDWALYGMRNCLEALGNTDALALVTDAICRAEHRGSESAA
jgi:tetratricopeptide (TPR) repeat protein